MYAPSAGGSIRGGNLQVSMTYKTNTSVGLARHGSASYPTVLRLVPEPAESGRWPEGVQRRKETRTGPCSLQRSPTTTPPVPPFSSIPRPLLTPPPHNNSRPRTMSIGPQTQKEKTPAVPAANAKPTHQRTKSIAEQIAQSWRALPQGEREKWNAAAEAEEEASVGLLSSIRRRRRQPPTVLTSSSPPILNHRSSSPSTSTSRTAPSLPTARSSSSSSPPSPSTPSPTSSESRTTTRLGSSTTTPSAPMRSPSPVPWQAPRSSRRGASPEPSPTAWRTSPSSSPCPPPRTTTRIPRRRTGCRSSPRSRTRRSRRSCWRIPGRTHSGQCRY